MSIIRKERTFKSQTNWNCIMGEARARLLMVMTSFHHQNLIKMQSDLYQTVVHLCGCSALEASANFNYTPSQLNTLHKINTCTRIYIYWVEILYPAPSGGGCKTTTAKTTADRPVPAVCSLFIGTFCCCSNSLVRAHTHTRHVCK